MEQWSIVDRLFGTCEKSGSEESNMRYASWIVRRLTTHDGNDNA